MGNTNQPNSPEQPNAADLALEERVRALELQVMEQRTGAEAPGTTAGDRPKQQAELSAELERHRNQLRDYEKALVERIADVDDDRRATASRLQRAWQTQREEIDERLRRYAGLVAGLLLLFAFLVSVALFLIYRQGTREQPQVAAEVAEMRQELDRLGADDRSTDRLKAELERLGKEVAETASSLERRHTGDAQADRAVAVERTLREEGEARVAKEMHRLKAEQTSFAAKIESGVAEKMRGLKAEQASLASEVESLRAALAAAQDARVATPAESVPRTAVEPHPGESTEKEVTDGGTPAAEAGTKDIAAATPEGASDIAGPATDADAGIPGSEETLVAGEGSYALQLIGFFNRDSLADFVAREGLPARVYYFRQTYKGRPWYVMVHSLHEGYAAAQEELSRLPADLAALSPWIRPVPAGTELRVLGTGPRR